MEIKLVTIKNIKHKKVHGLSFYENKNNSVLKLTYIVEFILNLIEKVIIFHLLEIA